MARPHPALLALAARKEPGAVPDPTLLLGSAREHRMTGLLLTWARARPDVDPSLLAALELIDLDTRAWHQRLWRTLAHVVQQLSGIGVDVATMKGVTCEARWYGRPGERPCADLDLLVGPDDLERASEVISVLDPGHPLRSVVTDLVRRRKLEAVAVHVDGVSVDVHFEPFQLGVPCRQRRVLERRTVRFPLPDGGSVRVLDAETSLIGLLLNLNRDRFRHLLGFVDIARILDGEDVDWRFVDHFLREEGLQTPAFLALETVTATLGIHVPRRGPLRGWRPALWRALWSPSVILQGERGLTSFRHRQHLLPLLATGRTTDCARLWGRLLLPAPVLVAHAYPSARGPAVWRVTGGRLRRLLRRRALGAGGAENGAAHWPPPSPERPAAMAGAAVPVPAPGVVRGDLHGNAVLLHEATGARWELDAVASLVWACFDGSATIDQIAAEVGEAFGAERDQVRAEIAVLAGRLQALGMLEMKGLPGSSTTPA